MKGEGSFSSFIPHPSSLPNAVSAVSLEILLPAPRHRLRRSQGDPFAILFRAGDGSLDEGHAGDAVGDARVGERLGDFLTATAADGPFEGPVQVGQGFMEALGVSGGEAEVRLDRFGEISVLGTLAIEPQRLAAGVVLEHAVL